MSNRKRAASPARNPPAMNNTLADYFTIAARNVLNILLREEPGIQVQPHAPVNVEEYDVAVSVEVTGNIRGQIVMLLSLHTIEMVAETLLSEFPEELKPSLKEHCVKEVVNMVTGEACTALMNDGHQAIPGIPIYYPRGGEMKTLLEKTDITRVLFSSKKGDIQFMVAVPASEVGPVIAPGQAGTILLVDDSLFILKLLRMILEGVGYTVVGEGRDGDEAISLYKRYHPALTIMDITMPHMNGVEAVKNIRAIDPTARILVCSAVANSKLIRSALAEGVLEFLAKPFDKEQVINTVARTINAPVK